MNLLAAFWYLAKSLSKQLGEEKLILQFRVLKDYPMKTKHLALQP